MTAIVLNLAAIAKRFKILLTGHPDARGYKL